jgi:hypothetical protein
MSKGMGLTRLDRPEDVALLNRVLDDVYATLEATHKKFTPGDAPKEPKGVSLYYDSASGKFKFTKPDGTTETITSS